jgi:hypothetical protein
MPMFVTIAVALTVMTAPRSDSAQCLRTAPLAATPPAAEWLTRARTAVGWARGAGRVLQLHAVDGVVQSYQSDRTYPPFFLAYETHDVWLDRSSGVERQSNAATVYPTSDAPGPTVLNTERATLLVQDTLRPVPSLHAIALTRRALDPWAVLADWSADADVRVAGSCRYRDYPRVALERRGPFGTERLLLDPKTDFPVALTRVEPHYLWGQVRAEYVYSTWIEMDGVAYPGATFRLADGAADISRSVTRVALTPRDSAPSLPVPAATLSLAPTVPVFLTQTPPDTIRVGPATFLLKNRGFTEAVTLAHDTVVVFDATQGDERARADSAWIGKLFPGTHPIILVVTDLAWPHVAGVRFWVASGATIVSHRISRGFLDQVLGRRWTAAPDKLERSRARARLVFRAVGDSLSLAGGAVSLYPIDGIASEGALMAFVRGQRFLWASDYVQTLQEASRYGREVAAAVRRVGVAPRRLAAEHLPLSEWAALLRVLAPGDSIPSS